jgi:hypothetical protein
MVAGLVESLGQVAVEEVDVLNVVVRAQVAVDPDV